MRFVLFHRGALWGRLTARCGRFAHVLLRCADGTRRVAGTMRARVGLRFAAAEAPFFF